MSNRWNNSDMYKSKQNFASAVVKDISKYGGMGRFVREGGIREHGSFIGTDVNISDQKIKQTNENIQEDLKQLTTENKSENIQDYMTYIRTTNRTTEEMKKNIKTMMTAAQNMIAENELNITGCAIFNDKFNNKQDINLEQELDQGIEALQKSIETIKAAAETESSTQTEVNQGAENDQKLSGTSSLDSTESNKASQEVEQENFSTVGRVSVMKLLGGFSGLGSMGKFIRDGGLREHAWLGANVNKSSQDIEQTNKNRQISQQILNSNTELSNKISSAYDKIVEVVNTISNEENKQAEIKATNDMNVKNKLNVGVDPNLVFGQGGGDVSKCLVFNGEFNNAQTIKAVSSLFMKGIIDQMSSAEIDNETKAIMADMMGLTQTNSSSQDLGASTDLKNKMENDGGQKSDQSNASLIGMIIAIVLVVLCGGGLFKFFQLGFPQWFHETSEPQVIYTMP